MQKRFRLTSALIVVMVTLAWSSRSRLTPPDDHRADLRFELNHGQSDPQVKFISRGPNYTLFLTQIGATLRLKRGHASHESVLRMQLANSGNNPRVIGLDPLAGKANYFIGNDPRRWRTNVPAYAKVRYEHVYPGVDLVFYGKEGYLEYDFIVQPHADPAAIALAVEGGKVEINDKGDLVVGDGGDAVRFQKPVMYQQIHGVRHEIDGGFVLHHDGRVGFQVGQYWAANPLIIDPVFVYSTYLGGSGDENRASGSELKRADIATDSDGNTYVIGTTDSIDFPTANALQNTPAGLRCTNTAPTVPPTIIPAPCPEAFVVKLSPTGSIVYSTYLGGSGLERGFGIAVNQLGSVYVAGRTQSDDFPTMNALSNTLRGGEDAFIAKLSPDGSDLIYSTYFGGNSPDDAVAIAVDSEGNACIVGETQSRDLPTTAAFQSTFGGGRFDAYVAKISATGSAIVYASYLGGGGEDDVEDVAIDQIGNALVVGVTNSLDFPTKNPLQQSFRGVMDATIVKLAPTGALINATYLGGTGPDYATAAAFSADGQVYVTGITESSDFPVKNELRKPGSNFGTDAFVTKFDPTMSSLAYSTYLGGSGEDIAYGIAVDSTGNVEVTGTTTSTDLPTVGATQESLNGVRDAFLVKLNASGSQFIYSSYLGGNDLDYGYGIALDAVGNTYLTGITTSVDFPTVFPFQPIGHSNRDAFVMKIANSVPAFTLSRHGMMSWVALGSPNSISVGYARIQPAAGQTAPSGLAIFSLLKGGVVISEASVSASAPIQNGRIYYEVNGGVNTGLAIANPGNEPASISFFFTDVNGRDFGHGSTNIPAQGQIARFLNEEPFNGVSSIFGTFTFSSSRPVAVIALRGLTNERSEFLITTLPVSGLSALSGSLIIPHFADGDGWTTQLELVNPTDEPLNGFLEFFAQNRLSDPGQPVTLTVDGQTASRFSWSIAPRGSRQLKTSGSSPTTRTGWVLITPATSSKTPSGVGIFSYRNRGITVTEAGITAMANAAAFRMYSEASGNFATGEVGSIQTGIAVVNPSESPVPVVFDLIQESGIGIPTTPVYFIPPRGHLAMFLNQITGFGSLRLPFKGLMRISTNSASGISVFGLRGRYNERGDFLVTSLTPANEGAPALLTELIFPHFARGGGYSTQFVVFNGSTAVRMSGSLGFFSQSGQVIP